MKYVIPAVFAAFVFLLVPSVSSAALTCGVGEVVQPGAQLTPAIPAVAEQGHWHFHGFPSFSWHWHVDVAAQPAVPATYAPDTCVPDANYVPPAPVVEVPVGGGTMPWCSGPMAPGWTVGLPNGGCSTPGLFGAVLQTYFDAGKSVFKNGISYKCPETFFMGCVI